MESSSEKGTGVAVVAVEGEAAVSYERKGDLAVDGRCRRGAAVCGRDGGGEAAGVAVAGRWRMWNDLVLLLLVCVIFQSGEADGGGRDMVPAAELCHRSPVNTANEQNS